MNKMIKIKTFFNYNNEYINHKNKFLSSFRNMKTKSKMNNLVR